MREKLLDLMKNEGLKPSQLAEMLEINPAGVSHILAGRNKPGFDLLQKILRRFPQINPDWLLLDSTKMYRNEHTSSSAASRPMEKELPVSGELFGQASAGTVKQVTTPQPSSPGQARPADARNIGSTPDTSSQPIRNDGFPVGINTSSPAIERVVIIYKDRTFESYTPKAE